MSEGKVRERIENIIEENSLGISSNQNSWCLSIEDLEKFYEIVVEMCAFQSYIFSNKNTFIHSEYIKDKMLR